MPVVTGDGNAVSSPSASVTVGNCRDCPHLTRLTGLLERAMEGKGK